MPAHRAAHGRPRGLRRPCIPALLTVVLLAACTFPELATPTPRPTPTPTTVPSPSASPTPSSSSVATASPDRAAIPDFAAGDIIASLIDGLRVRQRPGVDALVTTGLLPLDAEMQVVMGPFEADDFGWYLVTDADADEPQFDEGWVAAGYEPDPFLRSTGRTAEESPFVASLAADGDAEEGPIDIGDGDHAVRWIAGDPNAVGCRFAVSFVPAGGEPVAAIRATVGAGIDRGTLQPQTFEALGVSGPAFVSVTSDCRWALVVVRATEADPEPTQSAGA
jgi:hypothetical protein